jgi:hypothetical protein
LIVCDAFAVVLARVGGWVDGELTLTLRAIRIIAFESDPLAEHGEILCRRNDLSAVGRFVTEADDAASFLILHIALIRIHYAMLRAVSVS